MPKQIQQAINKHKNDIWSVVHTTNVSGHYTDIYNANNKPVFELSWWSNSVKPYWKVY